MKTFIFSITLFLGLSSFSFAYDSPDISAIHMGKSSFELWTESCENNDSGCYRLGKTYLRGDYGVEINEEKALFLFKKACGLGNKRGCSASLDFRVKKSGLGMNQFIASHIDEYKSLCEGGNSNVCNDYGDFLTSVGKHKEAFLVYKRSCDDTNVLGCAKKIRSDSIILKNKEKSTNL